MTGFRNTRAMVDAEEQGRAREYCFRKIPNVGTTAGYWFDLSLSPGNPSPQYYAATPMQSIAMRHSTDGGLYVGKNVTPYKKYLRHVEAASLTSALLAPYYLLDYLMFYPFIAEDTTDVQSLTQVDSLPRYTDGRGVQIMAVSVGSRSGGQTFRVGYTNSDGVAGRVTSTVIENNAAANGNIVSSNTVGNYTNGPFLTLQGTDIGVRQIDSFQMVSGTDVGLVTLVLVKPLFSFQWYYAGVTSEVDPLTMAARIPEIEDDAYLNFILCPFSSISGGTFMGTLKVVFN